MYITRIVLENVRGFQHLDFEMGGRDLRFAGWSVITGDNASGKTTLLKAIALALVGPEIGRALQPSLRGWIREGCDEATIAVEVAAGPDDRFESGKRYKKPFWSEIRLSRNGGPEAALTVGTKYKKKAKGRVHSALCGWRRICESVGGMNWVGVTGIWIGTGGMGHG